MNNTIIINFNNKTKNENLIGKTVYDLHKIRKEEERIRKKETEKLKKIYDSATAKCK